MCSLHVCCQSFVPILCPMLQMLCRSYRGLYILNWIYRYFTESHYRHQWAGEQQRVGGVCFHSSLWHHRTVMQADPLRSMCACWHNGCCSSLGGVADI